MTGKEYPRLGEKVFRRTLGNGLEVIVVSKPRHAKRYAFFATRYGGMDMRFRLSGAWQDTPAGIAHYLEHKMFDTEEGNALQELAKNGASENAFTSCSMTAYYLTCTEKFYENLRILLSFVSVPYFTQESVEKEQGIIAQEIRMVEDDPDWRVYANLMECLYQESPVRFPVAGTVESIRQITPQTLYDCHRAFYTPARREICQTMEVSMPMFLAGFKCRPQEMGELRLRQAITGAMACDALFGESSPLYTRLYEEGAINGSLGGNLDQVPGAAYLFVGGDAKDPAYVSGEIVRQAERLGREGIGEDFYQQIRRSAYGSMIRGLNSFEGIATGMTNGRFGGYDYYRFPEIFDTITKADVESFLRENVTAEHAALSTICPGA